jgi:hypothetical protein
MPYAQQQRKLEDGARIKAQTLHWDVMKPLPLLSPDAAPMRFDSMFLFYLLHYMPGLLSAKTYSFGAFGNQYFFQWRVVRGKYTRQVE